MGATAAAFFTVAPEASIATATDIGIGASAAGAAGTAAAGAGATNAALAEAAIAGGETGTALGGATLGTGAGIGATIGKVADSPFGKAITTGAGTAVASSLLNPRPNISAPTVAPVVGMPDPLAQQQAKQQSLIEQMARRGRASTILTDSGDGSGKLGA